MLLAAAAGAARALEECQNGLLPLPRIDGVYEVADAGVRTASANVTGVRMNHNEAPTVYGPGEPELMRIWIETSDLHALFVTETAVKPCAPLISDAIDTGCVDGFTNKGVGRPCVWTTLGPCEDWILMCSDIDDVGYKILQVLDTDESGIATNIILNIIETGPPDNYNICHLLYFLLL